MSTTAKRPGQWIGELFPKRPTTEQLQEWRNIWWRVVVTSVPPRDQKFEYEREMGGPLVEKVLRHQPLGLTKIGEKGGQHLLFVFPERWMSTQEEQAFVPLLRVHPDIWNASLTIIDIATKSPLIIGNFLKEDVRIWRSEEHESITSKGWDEYNRVMRSPKTDTTNPSPAVS